MMCSIFHDKHLLNDHNQMISGERGGKEEERERVNGGDEHLLTIFNDSSFGNLSNNSKCDHICFSSVGQYPRTPTIVSLLLLQLLLLSDTNNY